MPHHTVCHCICFVINLKIVLRLSFCQNLRWLFAMCRCQSEACFPLGGSGLFKRYTRYTASIEDIDATTIGTIPLVFRNLSPMTTAIVHTKTKVTNVCNHVVCPACQY